MSTKDRKWMDSLPDVGDCTAEIYAKVSLGQLCLALAFRSLNESQLAAAHIVRWRKSLGVESRRTEWGGIYTGDELLWCAAKHVTWAVLEGDDKETAANHLRYAEAACRKHWKEHQSTNPAHGGGECI